MLRKITSDGSHTLLDVLQRITGWDWVPKADVHGDLARNVAPPSRSLVAYVRHVEADDPSLLGTSLEEYLPFPPGYAAADLLPAGNYLVEMIDIPRLPPAWYARQQGQGQAPAP
jgi:hypothetical protein